MSPSSGETAEAETPSRGRTLFSRGKKKKKKKHSEEIRLVTLSRNRCKLHPYTDLAKGL